MFSFVIFVREFVFVVHSFVCFCMVGLFVFVCLFVCLFICLYLFVCLFVCLLVRMFLCLVACLFVVSVVLLSCVLVRMFVGLIWFSSCLCVVGFVDVRFHVRVFVCCSAASFVHSCW